MAKKISAMFSCYEEDLSHCIKVMDYLKDVQEMSDDEELIDFLIMVLEDYKNKKTSAGTDAY